MTIEGNWAFVIGFLVGFVFPMFTWVMGYLTARKYYKELLDKKKLEK